MKVKVEFEIEMDLESEISSLTYDYCFFDDLSEEKAKEQAKKDFKELIENKEEFFDFLAQKDTFDYFSSVKKIEIIEK